MPWSPRLRVTFTDEELVGELASTRHKPEERKGNWFTFFSNLPVPERQRLEAAAAARVGAGGAGDAATQPAALRAQVKADEGAAAAPRATRHRAKPVAGAGADAGAGHVSHAVPPARRSRHATATAAPPPTASTPGDADATLADLLAAARELTESARNLSQQMNDLASRIQAAQSARTRTP